jgi:hypothetical protein
MATVAVFLAGCGSIPVDVAQAGNQFIREWEQDKRPTLPDAEFYALSEEQQKFYMPETKVKARQWGHDQWDYRVNGNTRPGVPPK